MKVSHVNLQNLSAGEKNKYTAIFSKLLDRADYINGAEVALYEKEFADYIGTKYSVGVSNGTDAISLALQAIGISRGDEVILPTMTFMATLSPILHLGAKPIYIDSLPNSPLIDTELIPSKITKRTKAIVVVHLNGTVCNMNELISIKKKFGLPIIEDASQAQGSLYHGKKAGSFGEIATFSFYPSKNLGAMGDAGAVTTSNKKYFQKIQLLRNHGQKDKYIHILVGHNNRLDTLQAAILRYKLKNLDKENALRTKKAAYYYEKLKSLPLTFPQNEKHITPNFHNFVILTKERNYLKDYLSDNGIQTGIHYPLPLHLQPAVKYLQHTKGTFPNAERYAKQCLSLPMYPSISKAEQDFVIQKIKTFFNRPIA